MLYPTPTRENSHRPRYVSPPPNHHLLRRTRAFLFACSFIYQGDPSNTSIFLQLNPIPENPFPKHPNLRILRRITVILDDPSQNHRLAALTSAYDIVALRPTNEKLLLQACKELDCDLISVDLSQRMGYHFKHKTVGLAIQRGIFLEINYSASINDITARRNLIGNAAALIRATRGRGIVISSEARKALGVRGPFDVINLATLWGLSQDKGREAVDGLPRLVVVWPSPDLVF